MRHGTDCSVKKAGLSCSRAWQWELCNTNELGLRARHVGALLVTVGYLRAQSEGGGGRIEERARKFATTTWRSSVFFLLLFYEHDVR